MLRMLNKSRTQDQIEQIDSKYSTLHPPAEARSGSIQAPKLELFARISNSFELTLLLC